MEPPEKRNSKTDNQTTEHDWVRRGAAGRKSILEADPSLLRASLRTAATEDQRRRGLRGEGKPGEESGGGSANSDEWFEIPKSDVDEAIGKNCTMGEMADLKESVCCVGSASKSESDWQEDGVCAEKELAA